MEYGKRLNPECSLRTPKGIKGMRQKVIVTHNPSEIAAPYYQAGLGNRLCYELTFNDYNQVIKSTVSPKVPDAKYKITDISLEYEIATQPNLTRSIRSEYQHMALLYDRILRHRKIIVNKKDTVWNWAF